MFTIRPTRAINAFVRFFPQTPSKVDFRGGFSTKCCRSSGYVIFNIIVPCPGEQYQLTSCVIEVQAGRTINWQAIARRFPGRTNKDCRKRWYYHISQPLQRGPWSKEEDGRLRQGVRQYGTRWSKVADLVQTRNGDQCYKRWTDSLDPQIDKSPWTAEEVSDLSQVSCAWAVSH